MNLWILLNGLNLGGGAGPVLSLAGPATPGTSLTIASQTLALEQLWQLTDAGTVLSALDANLALTAGANGALTVEALQQGNEAQLWKYTPNQSDLGPLVNAQTG